MAFQAPPSNANEHNSRGHVSTVAEYGCDATPTHLRHARRELAINPKLRQAQAGLAAEVLEVLRLGLIQVW